MHSLIHSQALHVRPLQDIPLLPGHLTLIQNGCELYRLRLARGIDTLDKFAEREPHPRYNDRPSFYATVAIDALFWRRHLDDLIHAQLLLLLDQAVNLHLPWPRSEILCQLGWLVLAR